MAETAPFLPQGSTSGTESTSSLASAGVATPPPLTEAVQIKVDALPETARLDQPANIIQANKIAVLKGHRGWVMALAFAPNNDILASGGVDGTVRVWNFTPTGPQERLVPAVHQGDVSAWPFLPTA